MKSMKSMKFPIHLIASKLISNSQKALTLANTKKLGEIKNKQVIYSPCESLYLIETNRAELTKNSKPLTKQQAEKTLTKKYKSLLINYPIFKYLKQKGYIPKTGLKFGSDFRVYEKNKPHAKYLCVPISKPSITIQDFISKNRIAHSTAKKLLLAIIDSEDNISFYETDWIKP